MKLLPFLFLFALIYSASAQTTHKRLPNFIQRIRALLETGRNALNQQFINFIERERENFSRGWPALGIPPIDPLYIGEFEANLDEIGTLSSINFRLSDAYLYGLQGFEIESFDVRIIGLTVRFDIFFKQLELEGQHATQGRLGILPVSGTGPITMKFNDVRVSGEIQINTLEGGYLNLNTLYLNVTVRSVDASLRGFGIFLDPTISLLVSATLPTMINEGGEAINEIIGNLLIPAANEFLNQYRVVDLLLAIITSVVNPSISDPTFEV